MPPLVSGGFCRLQQANDLGPWALVQMADADRIRWRVERSVGQEMTKLTNVDELFEGRHFDREVIILCVRWYLRFKLSLRDLVEMMAERGLSLSHTTIMRWVQRYAPELSNAGIASAVPRVDHGASTRPM